MACDCAKYVPLEFLRKAINRRIKETPALKKRLERLASNEKEWLFLYRCPECGQHWQSGHEWNFGDKEYLFQVPAIEPDAWLKEPYAQPAAMLIYTAVMSDFEARSKFEESDNGCAASGCGKKAVKLSTFCFQHHIDSLQEAKLLPRPPKGRMFPPYHVQSAP